MHARSRGFAVTALLVMLPYFRATASNGDKTQSDKSSSSEILLDLVVQNEAGEFVTDLNPNDFEIYDGGVREQIKRFELRRLRPETSSQAAVLVDPHEPARSRRFILYVDALNTSIDSMRCIQSVLERFVTDIIEPSDRVMIAVLTPGLQMHLRETFTTDRVRLLRVIEGLRGNERLGDEIRPRIVEIRRKTLNPFQRVAGLPYERFAVSLRGLTSLVERIENKSERDGPLTVVYMSESVEFYDHESWSGESHMQVDSGRLPALRGIPGNQNYASPRLTPNYPLTQDIGPTLLAGISQLNRSVATVYVATVKAEGARLADMPEAKRILSALASGTGGLAYLNLNEMDSTFQAIERDNRLRYVLTYSATREPKESAEWHEVAVTCSRSDVRVRHQAGYLD